VAKIHKRHNIRAILFFGIAFFLCTASFAKDSWFRAKGPIGSQSREFLVKLQEDSVELFKGGHRPAPTAIEGQTYAAMRYVLMAQANGQDSLFWWHSVLLVRWVDSIPSLVWQNTVRGGQDANSWSRATYLPGKQKVEFHSPYYGDGEHALESGVIPDELLPLLAVVALKTKKGGDWKVLAPQWEQSYTRNVARVRIVPTEQVILIDDVQAKLVRLERDDKSIAEAWISIDGYQILRFKTFQGLWLERL